jgi:hypothetical protein
MKPILLLVLCQPEARLRAPTARKDPGGGAGPGRGRVERRRRSVASRAPRLVLMEVSDLPRALALLEGLASDHPDFAEAHNTLGVAYARVGRIRRAGIRASARARPRLRQRVQRTGRGPGALGRPRRRHRCLAARGRAEPEAVRRDFDSRSSSFRTAPVRRPSPTSSASCGRSPRGVATARNL